MLLLLCQHMKNMDKMNCHSLHPLGSDEQTYQTNMVISLFVHSKRVAQLL